TLLCNGYIGCSPLYPTVAISIRTLAVFRQTHRVCPRLSIQAEVRKLCHMHNVPYHRYLADQYSMAYDVYLEILHRVDIRVKKAMQHDSPDWRLKNACPACFYKLEDEPPLQFSFMCQMDGNNSLKRTNAAVRRQEDRVDTRKMRSDYWLHASQVDQFKDEVKVRQSMHGKQKGMAEDDEDFDLDSDSNWVDDKSDPVSVCIERWKNAGPEQCKRMFALFDECGIFLSACRHGTVLLICDMIQSGELAKYPLAVVDKLIDVFGDDIAAAFDIGCTFEKTLAKSSLGPKAKTHHLRMVVGAFHGHAHNRGCQLNWHPLYVPGMGRADLEGCERIFSSSNELAATTHHASKFHRWQAIEEHYKFWDEDKYAALSTYMFNHYREALKIIQEGSAELEELKLALCLTDSDFNGFLEQERAYLQGLKKEPPEETLRFEYVEGLENLAKARYATVELVKSGRHISSCERKLEKAQATVERLEDQIGIEARWDDKSSEYQAARLKLKERKYRKALDELERLVVQRLFELSKLNVSGTGYKLRTQIAKALQRRSEAIKHALQSYNTLAAKLSPPRPLLSWKQIVDYSFLGEFELLRLSRDDIREKPWAQPANREATIKYLQLQRAHEEIERLNAEMRRLRTAVRDEEHETQCVLRKLSESTSRSDNLLALEVERRWAMRSAINAVHTQRLDRIKRWAGFTGRRGAGRRLGSVLPGECVGAAAEQDEIAEDIPEHNIEDEEEVAQQLEGMVDFVCQVE
ncbi:hypothetical protein OE88DRAFT_1638090, partial [Heliocybe sulcata]